MLTQKGAAEAPTRTTPLPLEFPGVHYMDEEEIQVAVQVLRSRSLFRYYGIDLQNETQRFEGEFASVIGVRYALAVGSGTSALAVALSAFGAARLRSHRSRLHVGLNSRGGDQSRRDSGFGGHRRYLLPRCSRSGAADHAADRRDSADSGEGER